MRYAIPNVCSDFFAITLVLARYIAIMDLGARSRVWCYLVHPFRSTADIVGQCRAKCLKDEMDSRWVSLRSGGPTCVTNGKDDSVTIVCLDFVRPIPHCFVRVYCSTFSAPSNCHHGTTMLPWFRPCSAALPCPLVTKRGLGQ